MTEAFPIAPRVGKSGEPAFAEPWHAQTLAVAYALVERGVFDAAAWSDALGTERRRRVACGGSDDDDGYYADALAALECLLQRHGIAVGEIDAVTERWRAAYLSTRHGHPVELGEDPHGSESDEPS